MKLRFSKMHGTGNDYVYINCFDQTVENPGELSIKLSDRHFYIGSDGVILILPSDVADCRMRMFNADGSEGRMCGNGIRCVGKYVYDRGIARKPVITVETLSGIKTLSISEEGGEAAFVEVDMGEPQLEAAQIPMLADTARFIDEAFNVGCETHRATAVSMGNPHLVIFTEDIDSLDLPVIGPRFENDPRFPERVNTEFCEKTADGLRMRVWERGSGETMACGTGACASVVAAVLTGRAERGEEVRVCLRGGELHIRWAKDGHVFMCGPAVHVFESYIEV